ASSRPESALGEIAVASLLPHPTSTPTMARKPLLFMTQRPSRGPSRPRALAPWTDRGSRDGPRARGVVSRRDGWTWVDVRQARTSRPVVVGYGVLAQRNPTLGLRAAGCSAPLWKLEVRKYKRGS